MNDLITCCPACDGPGECLGPLGDLTHFRCRGCGITFSIKNEIESDNAQKEDPDPIFPAQCNYFEIFCQRDPAVGIPDVYEKVTFESGLVLTDANDAEEIRRRFGTVFYELYSGFNPLILFDFEPHEHYKPEGQNAQKEDPDLTDLPFDHVSHHQSADQWFAVIAVEKEEDGRELAIQKPDTLSTAVNIAERWSNRGHSYKKIIVRRQPDRKIVWDSTEQD